MMRAKRKFYQNWVLLVLGCVSLCACANHALRKAQDQAVDVQAQGDLFLMGLHREYLGLSEHAYYAGRAQDVRVFSRKARMAADGVVPAPAHPTSRGLHVFYKPVPEIQEAHDRLMAFLNRSVDQAYPRRLARAQGMYECWVAESRVDAESVRARQCQSHFEGVMGDIENLLHGGKIDVIVR